MGESAEGGVQPMPYQGSADTRHKSAELHLKAERLKAESLQLIKTSQRLRAWFRWWTSHSA